MTAMTLNMCVHRQNIFVHSAKSLFGNVSVIIEEVANLYGFHDEK